MRPLLHLVLAALALSLVSQGTAFARPDKQDLRQRYVITYKPGRAPSVDDSTIRLGRAYGFESRMRYRHALRGFAARLTDSQARRLQRDPSVATVTPDRRLRASGLIPVSPGEDVPTGVARIGAATGGVHGASTAAVAVLDTGIDLSHPDLNAYAGVNCVDGEPFTDRNGHGTFVAGVIAARNTGAGVVGVAPGTPVYSVKTLDSRGEGFVSEVICGIDWVTANAAALGIRVANLSFGGPGERSSCTEEPLHQAICNSTAAGVTYTVAAGNDARNFGTAPQEEPAIYPEVLTVTAASDGDGQPGALEAPGCVDDESDDRFASFSNFAEAPVDADHLVAAPGVCIISTAPDGGFETESGTSFAAPHVAGVVSLCAGEIGLPHPCADMTPADVIRQIRADAAARATAANGFFGDPNSPGPHYYGYLVSGLDPSVRRITGPQPPPPGPAADKSVSLLRVHAVHRQRAGRLRVTVQLDEPGTAAASATVRPDESLAPAARRLQFRLHSATRRVLPGLRVILRLNRPARQLRAVRRAVRSGRQMAAHITIRLHDAAGNQLVKRRTVLLVR